MSHKAGFVNIIGNPNVGKSTLMNAMVGEKLSIITSKAQTTRHRIFGIVNDEDYQIVFSDTPGIIKPAYDLQTSMMDFVKSAFSDADILIYMVEIGENELNDEARYIHGQKGKGFFTFYGGHDPEDFQHRVGDEPTVLDLHPNSPGFRLILNNVLFPAARKKPQKT